MSYKMIGICESDVPKFTRRSKWTSLAEDIEKKFESGETAVKISFETEKEAKLAKLSFYQKNIYNFEVKRIGNELFITKH